MTEQEGQVEQIGIIVVHGVSDVEPGVNSRTLARNVRTVLRQSGSDAPPVARAPFEVHQLDNPTPGREFGIHREDFQAYLTTMQVEAGPHLTFAEVYWADTTRSVPGKLSTFLDLIRSVFEFHGLFDAMIERSRSRREDLLARFLHLCAWIVRGPLAGLQTAAIVIGLATCTQIKMAISEDAAPYMEVNAGPPR